MDHELFDWDDTIILHIAAHDVLPEEAEEVLLGDPMELEFDVANGEERWTYVGETNAGRVLTVVFTTRSERMRVVTAFNPSPLRMRIFLQWRAQQS
jgi:uncharacterized DUF497 family protein